MYCNYQDIIEKLGEPKWWDENGVPRYCDFNPSSVANIYADHAALVIIQCQHCGRFLQVAWSFHKYQIICFVPEHHVGKDCFAKLTLPTKENPGSVGYGDAPSHDDPTNKWCHAGCTMTTEVLKIKEFYSRDNLDWVRHPEFEFDYLEQIPQE